MNHSSLSAGAVIVRRRNSTYEFLLLRCFNYWDFPKGLVEDNEDAEDAATREIEEETDLRHLQAHWGKEFYETLPYGKRKIARYYLYEVNPHEQVRLKPNPSTGVIEHHEFLWLSYEDARGKLVPRVKEVLDWAKKKISSN